MAKKPVRILPLIVLLLATAGALYWHFSPNTSRYILAPVDEAAQDAAFLTLRTRLLEAVRSFDIDVIMAATSNDITLSSRGSAGRETFRQWLTIDEPGDPESYWHALERVLAYGGVFLGPDTFCAPYFACMELPICGVTDCDGYTEFVAITPDAPVYERPGRDWEVIARLAYEVVLLAPDDDPFRNYPWYRILLADGRTGWVSKPDFYRSVDYHALFERRNGAWEMTKFLAGD